MGEMCTETQLWIDNNEPLYRRKWFMFAHLLKFLQKGKFDEKKALKLFRHLTDEAARSYKKEIGEVLDVKDRRVCEQDFVNEFKGRIKNADEFWKDLFSVVGRTELERKKLRLPPDESFHPLGGTPTLRPYNDPKFSGTTVARPGLRTTHDSRGRVTSVAPPMNDGSAMRGRRKP